MSLNSLFAYLSPSQRRGENKRISIYICSSTRSSALFGTYAVNMSKTTFAGRVAPWVSPTTTGYYTSMMSDLTTTFTPPSSCFDRLYFDQSNPNAAGVQVALGTIMNSKCYPSSLGYIPLRGYNGVTMLFAGYYSPGICPSGYMTACAEYSPWLYPSESGYLCCPRYVKIMLFLDGKVPNA